LFRVLFLIRTELIRALRDGNTLLFIGFPVLAYPVLIWGTLQLAMYVGDSIDDQPLQIVLLEGVEPTWLEGEPLVFADGGVVDLDAGRVQAVVSSDGGEGVEVRYRSGSSPSRRALGIVEERLERHGEQRLVNEALDAGARESEVIALELEIDTGDDGAAVLMWILGLFVGPLSSITILVSTLSPAIILFVVEREQGSLETTLTSSASRATVVLTRLMACAILGAVAALANIGALGLTIADLALLLVEDASTLGAPPLTAFFATLLLVGSGSVVVSTMIMLSLSVARTFREAQPVGSALLLVLMFPAISGMLGTLGGWADRLVPIPVAHIGLLVDRAIRSELTLSDLGVALGTDLLFVVTVLALWRWVFGVDSLLSGLSRPAWISTLLGESR